MELTSVNTFFLSLHVLQTAHKILAQKILFNLLHELHPNGKHHNTSKELEVFPNILCAGLVQGIISK